MFSIICVYNNKKVLNDVLLKSLFRQNSEYELILLDNTKNRFKSAAQALNYGVSQIKKEGRYLMFVHQDIELCSDSWLVQAEKYLDEFDNLGIAGIAGMSEIGKNNPERGRNIVFQNIPREKWPWGNKIFKPEKVQTLDECLIIIPKKIFKILKFDECTCDGWDFYAVDYCLSARNKNLIVYVLPLLVYHKGKAKPVNKGFYEKLNKLLIKHRKNYDNIYATTGKWNTKVPLFFQRTYLFSKVVYNSIKNFYKPIIK